MSTDESSTPGSSIRELFPPDDPAARFVMSMALVRNVLEPLLVRVEEADATERPGFTSEVVTLTGYVVEASVAWVAYRETYPEVRALIGKLPRELMDDVKLGASVRQRVGSDALDQSRNAVFHFPAPDKKRHPDSDEQLRDTLNLLGEHRATVVTLGEPRRYRLGFADDVLLVAALGRHSDDKKKLRQQFSHVREAAHSFVRLGDALTSRYFDARGATFGEPEYED